MSDLTHSPVLSEGCEVALPWCPHVSRPRLVVFSVCNKMTKYRPISPFLCMDMTYITCLLKDGFGFKDNTVLQVRLWSRGTGGGTGGGQGGDTGEGTGEGTQGRGHRGGTGEGTQGRGQARLS